MRIPKEQTIIVIGGLVDDCHQVGIDIIRRRLTEEGYCVMSLGITTPLDIFFRCTQYADMILVSSVNGHGFENFADEEVIFRFEQFRRKQPSFPFIIGGNLHPYKDPLYIKEFLERKVGLSEAIPKPVTLDDVIGIVKRHAASIFLSTIPFAARKEALDGIIANEFVDTQYLELSHVEDKTRDAGLVYSMGAEFKMLWETAKEVPRFEDIMNAQLRKPFSLSKSILTAEAADVPLVHPRCGVGVLEEQDYLFNRLEAAGADVLSFQVDSHTRNGNFFENQKMLQEQAVINGYPLINHGISKTKGIVDKVRNVPVQVRHGSKPRVSVLLAYQSLAAGVTGFEGGAGTYLFPYFKSIPLANSIHYWQMVDRLVGLLAEQGAIVNREFFGTLTATLIPPEIAIAVNVMEALLAARQGVKSLSLGYAEQGNRAQDIAALLSLRSVARYYLDRAGFRDVHVSTVLNSFMAGFPEDKDKAEEIIVESAATARLGRASRIMIKTAVEAFNIPTVKDNEAAVHLTRRGFQLAGQLHKDDFSNSAPVEFEKRLIQASSKSIIDSILDCGGGDVARGFVYAIKNQYLDIPFSPNFQVQGKIVCVRDCDGAVRIYQPGNVQVPDHVLQFYKALIHERMRKEETRNISTLIYKDVSRIPRTDYLRWPLDGHYVE
jgi:methylaspartate mutase epsilon subunit